MKELLKLMEINHVTEVELKKAVAAAGYYAESTPINNYDAEFIDKALIGAWPQVLENIKKLRVTMFKNRVLELEGIIENVTCELEKACFILNYWQNEYLFHDKPDPRAAVVWGSKIGPKTAHEKQSARWFFEYEQITNFVNVTSDYVFAARLKLQEVIEK
ncbi:MAG: hypothetical protein PHT79_06690 [Syntrophomonadaceae bacterium]|nr:hypothetical protein [Syntrophomonadaceae bacterium]MDD3897962.1 hypothetical protein [Syntrophomonadaceae bacterium]MDD4549431.1 hypothetical protein [Syntrophomonadaceae bacterium]